MFIFLHVYEYDFSDRKKRRICPLQFGRIRKDRDVDQREVVREILSGIRVRTTCD